MPMLTLREFTYEELKSKLKPNARIVVVSCDSCARMSDGLGGRSGLDSLADKLEADGFNIVLRSLVAKGCHANFLEDQLKDPAVVAAVKQADVVLPLMCVSGEKTTGDVLPAGDVLRVAASVGKGPGAGETGARLTRAFDSAGVDVDEEHSMGLDEVARKTGRHSGPF